MPDQGNQGEQGKQGAQGVQGSQGVQGLQGPQGEGERGKVGKQGERGKAGTPFRSRNVGLSFWAVVILAFVLVSFQSFQRQTTCKDIEAVKTLIRQEAVENYAKLDQNLALLKIEKTPEIEARALAIRDNRLKRFAAREEGCHLIPYVG